MKTLFLMLFLACLSTSISERPELSKNILLYKIGTRIIAEKGFMLLSKKQRKLLILNKNHGKKKSNK